jgi:hypothetical protein
MVSVMPSLRNPSLLTMLVCPQKPLRNTGVFGATMSSALRQLRWSRATRGPT